MAKSKKKQSEDNLVLLNTAHEEMITEQEADLSYDYDTAYAEWKTKEMPYKIKFLNQIFEVPRSQPFAYALFVSKHTKKIYDKKKGKEVPTLVVPDDKGYEYVKLMFGNKFVEAMEKSNVEIDFVMNKIAPEIHLMWQGLKRPENDLKNVQTPGS